MITAFALLALTSTAIPATGEELQRDLVLYASEHVGVQVGNGQCADLIAYGLNSVNAKPYGTWADSPSVGDYVWGKKIATLTKGEVTPSFTPGTILQLRDVKVVTTAGYATFTYSASQHTLIIEKYNAETGEANVLEQNSKGRTYVTRGNLNLKDLKAGTIWAYAPQPK